MFSLFIQSKVEEQLGNSIENVCDCECVSLSIFEKIDMRISGATLAEVFGINSRRMEPALFTAEVLANYLGYKSSAHLRSEFNQLKFKELIQAEVKEYLPYTSTCVSV